MEVRTLVSFLTLAEELHFGRAAARLHLAQPSLSQQLQRLEKEIGVELVRRTSHEVRLTPAGEVFRAAAERLVRDAARAVDAARTAAAGRAGTVNVGFNYPAGVGVLPATLARLAADHPLVLVHLWERRSGPQLEALLAGDLDVGFVYGRPVAPRLESRELLRLPVVALVGRRHPWARRDAIAVRELGEWPCVLFRREQSPALHDAVTGAAGRAGATLRVAEEIDDPLATGVVVAARPLIGFASAARAVGSSAPDVVVVPLTAPTPVVSLHAVWRSKDTTPAVTAFLASLTAAAPFGTDADEPVPVPGR